MAEEQRVIIPRVKLGNQGLEVSKLGFGCMGLSGMYNAPLPEEAGITIIKEAYNKGITFFDTADVYGPHTNEILVGKLWNFASASELKIFGLSSWWLLMKLVPFCFSIICHIGLELM
ncbi:hypothetical protein OIU85_004904 [Salix viminalis]|uniref:NADP-dependent oxidoreductase domain-containing protein n=1 Tax=Salix viminalis TaxID=40686 RepID=A0A9Q0PTG5_SALVM|nr:hypothetical protein OIU85_004903 [Salix viminalis]KAJ6694163.1 hypothetical protein OIU85_004904 [Salix viminalis]